MHTIILKLRDMSSMVFYHYTQVFLESVGTSIARNDKPTRETISAFNCLLLKSFARSMSFIKSKKNVVSKKKYKCYSSFFIPDPRTSSLITATVTTASSPISSTVHSIDKPPSSHFTPPNCSHSSFIGQFCNVSAEPCDIQKPCRNSDNCTNDPKTSHGYFCTCKSGFNGTNCEIDVRRCQPNTCLYNGM
jgi:hypothetical protein